MKTARGIKRISHSEPTLEGAGVRLKRAFGFGNHEDTDPFLMLDDFRSDDPKHYRAGFPWHPHRGIETISYVLRGEVEHGDSMGNSGVIGAGDVQWMTAGSGIIHQEMPAGDADGAMWGFQLWANLPASQKMMSPRYRDVASDTIPEVSPGDGVKIKIISGELGGVRGPVRDIVIEPELLDVTVPADAGFEMGTKRGHTVIVYVIGGGGRFGGDFGQAVWNETLVLFEDGDEIAGTAGKEGMRFLFISGKPLREPIAWQGPIVMNTQEELRTAFEEYQKGTFIKHGK